MCFSLGRTFHFRFFDDDPERRIEARNTLDKLFSRDRTAFRYGRPAWSLWEEFCNGYTSQHTIYILLLQQAFTRARLITSYLTTPTKQDSELHTDQLKYRARESCNHTPYSNCFQNQRFQQRLSQRHKPLSCNSAPSVQPHIQRYSPSCLQRLRLLQSEAQRPLGYLSRLPLKLPLLRLKLPLRRYIGLPR